ncbi:MAG: hypothetical protein DME45_10145 [Verrucomicrobia bacterium]|nr:MAG: hypothetical protein DME45_10145 [Verrucomicrobiota bacterium]
MRSETCFADIVRVSPRENRVTREYPAAPLTGDQAYSSGLAAISMPITSQSRAAALSRAQ